MVYPGQPDWDERVLLLDKPELMDTATLIEWIQRQLETPLETLARFQQMREQHEEWHGTVLFGIYACCINTGSTHSEYSRIMAKYGDWNTRPGRVFEVPPQDA